MLTVLHGTINGNKKPLLLRVWEMFTDIRYVLGVSLMPVMVHIGWHSSPSHVNAQPKGGIKECGGFEAIPSFSYAFSPLLFLVSQNSPWSLLPPFFLLRLVIYGRTHPSPVNRWWGWKITALQARMTVVSHGLMGLGVLSLSTKRQIWALN